MSSLNRGARRTMRSVVAGDLEILPLMNLFIVLIPMLLLSAVFVELSVIDLNLPAEASASEPVESLDLSVTILDDGYRVDGNGLASQHVSLDEVALETVLRDIAVAHPMVTNVRIVSTPSTRYQAIVSVMDVSRVAGLPDVGLVGTDVEEG